MMEAVPRLPMLSFDLKISPEPTSFGPKLKQYIRDFYHEDPEMYSNEIHALDGLRASAVCAVKDVTGCSKLKEYYCQLHFLQSRFPMNKDGVAAVPFTWRDTYASMVCTLADIQFEMVAILYNIGALHSQLGAGDSRVTADGMKMSCTHFQCAAWAFQHLKDTYPQPAGIDLAPDVMQFMYHLSLAQAQECILEKSMMDNRKATIIAKVAVQIVDYYNLALNTLEQGGSDDCSISETVGSKIYKNWKRYVKFKVAYHTCVSLLYQGQQAEEQQKMGERVAYYQAASEKLEEAAKLSKGMDNIEMVNETLAFTRDVVEGKKKAAKNENEFIYHEEVPDRDLLPDIKGASLVKGIPFSVNDPEVAGPDIFARLVPMKAHEASSLYSEEKAKLLRKVGEQIDEKNEELVSFMTSLQLEHLHLHSEPDTLPQELVDCCAAFSAKPNAIQNLIDSMNKLADTYQDVEAMLQEIKEYLEMEEAKEKEYQEIMGKRPPSIVATDLTREANKYQEAHSKASESNQTLHKAMTLHVSNLRILSLPLAELQKQIPSITSLNLLEDDAVIKEMKHLVDKVEEMKRQRAMLASQLRESTCQDDITRQLVTRTSEPLDNIFNQEMQKHQRYVSLIEQNLNAQENILKALTDAYARYGGIRKATNEIVRKRESTINALIASYNAYEDLLAKSSKGLEFYRKLETNVGKLLQRVKSTCKVQEEEREQILAKNNKRLPDKIRETELLTSDLDTPSSGGPKLKDYLQSMKRGAAAVGGYGASIDRSSGSYYPAAMSPSYNQLPSSQPGLYDQIVPSTTTAQWIPAVRPAPVGSEGTGEQSSSLCSSNSSKQNVEDNKALISNYPKDSFGYSSGSTSGYVPYPAASSSHYPPSSAPYSGTSYDVGYNAASQPSGHPYSYSQPQQQQQQQQHFPESYSPNPNYSYGVQSEGLSNHGRYSDPSSAQSAFPQDKSHQLPAAGQSSQIPNQYASSHSTYTQQRGQSGYQHPAYQQAGYPVSLQNAAGAAAAAYGGTSYDSSTTSYPGTSFTSSQPGHTTSAFPYSVPAQQSYSALTNQQNPYAITSQAAAVSTQSNSYSYTGQTGYGYTTANGSYQNNTGYPATQNSWQPVASTSSAGSVAPSDSMQYYGGEFHAKPTGSSTSVSSGSSAEVSLGTQQPAYSSAQQGYPVASSTYLSQSHPTSVSMPTSSVLQSSEYQYMQGSIASCYTNAGKYATSQTCSSQTSVEGQTFAAQYNANQGMQQYQAQGYGQNYYYTVPYGYHYSDGNIGSPSPSPQHTSQPLQLQQQQQQQQQQLQQHHHHQQQQQQQQQPPYPQPFQQSQAITQQQTPQSPMTYMQARDLTQQSTTTTNVHGSSSRSSTSLNSSANKASTSNVDLLAGLDFSINHDPLTPQQTPVVSVKNEEHPVKATVHSPVKQKSTNNIGVSPPIQSLERSVPSSQVPEHDSKFMSPDVKSKLEAQINGATDHIPSKSDDVQSEIVTKLEVPDVTESQKESKQLQKLFGKDPYTDPEALNQFVQEVEKYEKFVAGLTTKTLNGPTPLDMKWKELLDLQEKDAHKHNISVARCYPMKNRFPDILPYDHSRIELPSTKDDYINASFMKELTSLTPPFIMTQAPLPSTYADFWTMVYEQQVEVVVCLLSDTELSGQTYWPVEKGQELIMGKMKLTLQSSNIRPHWVERILSISIADTRFTRVVIHLQFTAWPGSSFPASPGPFLSFVSEALNFYRQQRVPSHPLVVHCLSGVGRTGLFCLVAAAILDIQASRGILDLVTATANMSAHRKGSLRDREHLKFAYQAVLYYAQDLLMKRGILTSRSTFEDKRNRGGKSHTRHPSEDFLLGPPTDLSQLQSGIEKMGLVATSSQPCEDVDPAQTKDCSSSCSSSGRSSPYLHSSPLLLIDPARFSLNPSGTPSKSRKRYTRDSFTVKSSDSMLAVTSDDSNDPLSQLDPLWPLKRQ